MNTPRAKLEPGLSYTKLDKFGARTVNMALGFFDFLGFGSKRRSALQLFDRTLSEMAVNPAYIDDGMRFAIYKWALLLEAQDSAPNVLDRIMRDAAGLMSYCVLGPAETESLWGPAVRANYEARFDAVLARGEEESFDALLIKLVLAKGIADPDLKVVLELGDRGSGETAPP